MRNTTLTPDTTHTPHDKTNAANAADKANFEINSAPPPTQPLSLRTIWPQLAAGAILAAAIVGAAGSHTATSGVYVVGTAFMFGLTVLYLASIRHGWSGLTSTLTWVGGIGLAVFSAMVTPSYLPLATLFIFAAVCYGLGASGRRVMFWGTLCAWMTLVALLLVGLSNDLRVPLIASATPPLGTKIGLLALSALLALDILQRLWRHYNRTRMALTNLQQANAELFSARTQLEQHVREQAELLDVTRAIGSTLDLNPLLDEILVQLGRVMGYSSATVLTLKDSQVQTLRHTGDLTEFVDPLGNLLAQTPHWKRVIELAQPVIVPDVRTDAQFRAPFSAYFGSNDIDLVHKLTAWMGVPLVVRGKTIGMLALTHPDSAFFTSKRSELAMAFANQAAVAIEAARARDEAIAAATLAERQRLARNLHDSVSQSLFGMVLTTRAALELFDTEPNRARASMGEVLGLADAALSEMRALIFELRPETLQEDGLLTALRKQARALSVRHKVTLTLDLCADEPELSIEVKEALYRVSMEAVQNTVHHAQATHLRLTLRCDQALTTLTVMDDGCGFDPSQVFSGSFGLRSMRERAELVGGILQIDSSIKSGTTVRFSLPSPACAARV